MSTETESFIPKANGVLVTTGAPLIYQKLAAVMADIEHVGKTRENSFHGYKFRGIDDVLTEVAPALRKHGVVMIPNIDGEPKVVERATTKGKAELHIVVKVRWTLYAPDGSHVEASTLGEASDSGDKGCNKAMSASQKYALIQIFSIPTEGDNDTENRSPEFAAKGTALTKAEETPDFGALAKNLRDSLATVTTAEQAAAWKKNATRDLAKLKQHATDEFDAIVAAAKAKAESLKGETQTVCDACHKTGGHVKGCPNA